jgi:hypothetical protein
MAVRSQSGAIKVAIRRAHRAGLKTLSPRALELLCRLIDHRGRGLPTPNYWGMRAMMGLKGNSLNDVSLWLGQLRDAGCVEWEKGNAKTLRILVRIEVVRHDVTPAGDAASPAAGGLSRG